MSRLFIGGKKTKLRAGDVISFTEEGTVKFIRSSRTERMLFDDQDDKVFLGSTKTYEVAMLVGAACGLEIRHIQMGSDSYRFVRK